MHDAASINPRNEMNKRLRPPFWKAGVVSGGIFVIFEEAPCHTGYGMPRGPRAGDPANLPSAAGRVLIAGRQMTAFSPGAFDGTVPVPSAPSSSSTSPTGASELDYPAWIPAIARVRLGQTTPSPVVLYNHISNDIIITPIDIV